MPIDPIYQENSTFAVIETISSLVLKLILIAPLLLVILLLVILVLIFILIIPLSDLSSIGSVDQVTVMDSTFAAISAIPSPALVKHQKYLDTAGSVPHLDR